MTAEAHTIGAGAATRTPDRPVTKQGQTCQRFPAVMRRAQGWWTNKTAEQIAARTHHHVRSVRRWMAGETTPDVDVGFDLITCDRGPSVIETVAASMPAKERVAFWKEMGRVAKRAELKARQELLDLEDE